MRITLTPEQVSRAAAIGKLRNDESLRMGLKDKHACVHDTPAVRLEKSINGACGELAAALALGLEWDESVNTFKQPDLCGMHVRCATRDHYRLIIRDGDPAGIYIHVTGTRPNFIVHGCAHSARVCVDKFRDNPNGIEEAWFIPASELSSLDKLQDFIKTKEQS